MSLLFSIYTKEVFKEYPLPSISNADHTITLRQDEYDLEQDVYLKLEVIENEWRIRSTPQYRITESEKSYAVRPLRDQQILKLRLPNGNSVTAIITEVEQSFSAFEKFPLDGIEEITIGRDESSDIIYNFMGIVSRRHAIIYRKAGQFVIESLSPNGSYVNGERVAEPKVLSFGDYINIVGLHLVFLGNKLAVDSGNPRVRISYDKFSDPSDKEEKTEFMAVRRQRVIGKKLFHRSPRIFGKVAEDPIEIEAPPQLQKQKKQSLMMMIGPSLTMAIPMILGCVLMIYAYSGGGSSLMGGRSSLFMYSGLVMAVSSAGLGVVWALSSAKNQKKEEDEEEANRLKRYGDYLIEKTEEIRERYEKQLAVLRETYPEPEACLSCDVEGGSLWNRNQTHEDFLVHRLGLGERPFDTEIIVPQKRFSLQDDELAEKAAFIKENYQTLYDAPVTLDLDQHNLIGVIGGKQKKGAIEIARILSLQIAAGNCYTDVKLGYVYNGESSEDYESWDYARWFPHVWAEDRKTRFIAANKSDASEVFFELANIFRDRLENSSSSGNDKEIPKPYYVLFISDQSMLEGEPFAKYITSGDPACGLTTILLAESYEQLPNSCDFIIENTDEFKGSYAVYGNQESKQEITFDSVDTAELEVFARRIAGLRVHEIEETGELPNSLSYFDMMNIRYPEDLQVREYWAKNRTYDNIRGQLGIKTGGEPCYLDVHEKYHGPHGLVAGTTGSGKSETLQTYLLSLAVNYSPDDIGFFIIDFKGGGMANLFEGMPHLSGMISNLSGNQIHRAMISIKSENRRRQRIFNENGVNNINNYTKLVKNGEAKIPVPHLFIVIDEFAELKREEPDFMRELISVAQVGRSLGVHLILATQKPSGTVDDNIWSNSKFRLCLRVQDRQDSIDMLHKPDAAFITQAGRGYLQVGNDEVYELFQSGYSGASYDENIDVGNTDIARLISNCGKIEMKGVLLKQAQKKALETAWIKRLLNALNEAVKSTRITPRDALSNYDKLGTLQQGFYEALQEMKIYYPVSVYNSARIEDFIKLCVMDADKNGGNVKAERVAALAAANEGKLPQIKDRTEFDAIKDYLAKVAADSGFTQNHQLWLPVLREAIYLDEFEEYRKRKFSESWGWNAPDANWNLNILLGQWDDPENQSQPPMFIDFAEQGNIAIFGSVASGKSTTMQSIAFSLINRFSPDAVNLYALDFSSKMMSAFEGAPHFGGVMFENDTDKIDKFFNMIKDILEERKTLLRGGSFRQYVQVNDTPLPAIIIFVDNYGSFKEKTNERYEETMVQLSKEGVNHGIFLVVSGGGISMNEIPTRIAENMGTALTLSLPDKFVYGDLLHTMQIDNMPEAGVKGRGLALLGNRPLEYQTALAVQASDDYKRMELIRQTCAEMSNAWTGKAARVIPEIPEKPEWKTFAALEEYQKIIAEGKLLPIGYNADNAAVWGIPLAQTYCYGVYGSRLSGKSNFLKACLMAALDQKAGIGIIDGPDGKLNSFKQYENIKYLSTEQEIFTFFEQLLPVIQKRNTRKNELLEDGYYEETLVDAMQDAFPPIYIVISDLAWFVDMIYNSELDMRGFLENIIGKGSQLNIYFIAGMSLENRANVAGYQLFELFTSYKTGVQLGGKPIDNPLLNFEHIPYAQQSRSEEIGVGLLPDRRQKSDPWRIVVPHVITKKRGER